MRQRVRAPSSSGMASVSPRVAVASSAPTLEANVNHLCVPLQYRMTLNIARTCIQATRTPPRAWSSSRTSSNQSTLGSSSTPSTLTPTSRRTNVPALCVSFTVPSPPPPTLPIRVALGEADVTARRGGDMSLSTGTSTSKSSSWRTSSPISPSCRTASTPLASPKASRVFFGSLCSRLPLRVSRLLSSSAMRRWTIPSCLCREAQRAPRAQPHHVRLSTHGDLGYPALPPA